ncbi:MAG: glycosyltransferase family 39 protein, partial [Patescibacteria group bacterium]|nr:glycosyltransferase family 39 protein [Patescibacteria group bacterium]
FFIQEGFITTDGVSYVLAGKNLITSGKYEVFGNPQLVFSPGYPILVGIADYFFNDLVFSARFVSFVAGFLAVYLFYLIGKQLHSKKVGLFASALAAIHYVLVIISAETLSESLGLLFILISLYLYFRLVDNYKNWLAMLLGCSIGYLYLIRSEGILLLALPVVFLLINIKKAKIKKSLKGFSLIIIFFLIIVAPYFYFLYQNTGKLIYNGKTTPNLIVSKILNGKDFGNMSETEYNTYEKTFSHYDEKTNSIKLPEEFSDINLASYIIDDLAKFFQIFLKGASSETRVLSDTYWLAVFLIPILLFVLFIITKKFKPDEKVFVLFLLLFLFLSIFPIFHIESRYLLQPFIFIIFLSSLGCFLDDKMILSRKYISELIKMFFLSLKLSIFVFVFIFSTYYLFFNSNDHINRHKIAAEYIKNNSKINYENIIIMSRKPEVAFYAQSKKSVPVPYTNIENVLKFAKANKVNYIVIDEKFLNIRDNYDELENLDKHSNQVELVFEDNSISLIKVFEVLY